MLILALLASSIVAFARARTSEMPDWVQERVKLLNQRSILSLDEISAMIKSGRYKTIDDFIAALPPELRGHQKNVGISLGIASRSQQFATIKRPRILLWGDPFLTMACNGDSSLAGFHKLEMYTFNPQTFKFEFQEGIFESEQKTPVAVTNPRNPFVNHDTKVCTHCHGASLKPNWRSYPFWEGFFGSSFGMNDFRDHHARESEIYEQIKSDLEKSERYRHLKLPNSTSQMAMANSKLSHRLLDQNAWKVAAEIRELIEDNPEYQAAIFATLITAIDGATEEWDHVFQEHQTARIDDKLFASYLPAKDRKSYRQSIQSIRVKALRDLSNLRREQLKTHLQILEFKPKGTEAYGIEDNGQDYSLKIARTKFVFGEKLGVDLREWTTSYLTNAFEIRGPERHLLNLVFADLVYLKWDDPNVQALAKAKTVRGVKQALDRMLKCKDIIAAD